MEILANETDWAANDEQNFAAFLETPTGRRFIPALARTAPSLLEKGHINAILIRSGEVRAFANVIEAIVLLAHPPAPLPQQQTQYPALEDDAAWGDGQKLATDSSTPNPQN